MLKNRVIPCLLLQNGGLVKTSKFSKPKYVGDPINAIRIFNDKEVDELLVLDIAATKENREPDYDLIEQFAGECFMPLAYGGGIRTADQVRRLFALGVEKVCLQSAVVDDPEIIRRLSEQFGSQSIIVSVDIKRNWRNRVQLHDFRAGGASKVVWTDFVRHAVELGAGEILFNAVHRDGTMSGMDVEAIRAASKLASVPLIAVGGARNLTDFRLAIDAGASAVSAGAFFVFHGPHRAVLITYPSYDELQGVLDDDEK